VLLTVLLFPTLVVSVVFCLKLIAAKYYDTTHALHLSTIFKVSHSFPPSIPSSFFSFF